MQKFQSFLKIQVHKTAIASFCNTSFLLLLQKNYEQVLADATKG